MLPGDELWRVRVALPAAAPFAITRGSIATTSSSAHLAVRHDEQLTLQSYRFDGGLIDSFRVDGGANISLSVWPGNVLAMTDTEAAVISSPMVGAGMLSRFTLDAGRWVPLNRAALPFVPHAVAFVDSAHSARVYGVNLGETTANWVTVARSGSSVDAGSSACTNMLFFRYHAAGARQLLSGRHTSSACTVDTQSVPGNGSPYGFVLDPNGPVHKTQQLPSLGAQFLSSVRGGFEFHVWQDTANRLELERMQVDGSNITPFGDVINADVTDIVAGLDGGYAYVVGHVPAAAGSVSGTPIPYMGTGRHVFVAKVVGPSSVEWVKGYSLGDDDEVPDRAALTPEGLFLVSRCANTAVRCVIDSMWLRAIAP